MLELYLFKGNRQFSDDEEGVLFFLNILDDDVSVKSSLHFLWPVLGTFNLMLMENSFRLTQFQILHSLNSKNVFIHQP